MAYLFFIPARLVLTNFQNIQLNCVNYILEILVKIKPSNFEYSQIRKNLNNKKLKSIISLS